MDLISSMASVGRRFNCAHWKNCMLGRISANNVNVFKINKSVIYRANRTLEIQLTIEKNLLEFLLPQSKIYIFFSFTYRASFNFERLLFDYYLVFIYWKWLTIHVRPFRCWFVIIGHCSEEKRNPFDTTFRQGKIISKFGKRPSKEPT